MASEDNLIRRIARGLPSISGFRPSAARNGIPLGIGDDAAVLTRGTKLDWVFTCDVFLEGIHFIAETYPAESVGYKALVRATSDLVAMGATPKQFLLTLAIPSNRQGQWLDSFLLGMRKAAKNLQMQLIGGDTTRCSSVFISITAIGEIGCGLSVKRSGARPGDLLYVSGTLGRAQLGLELMQTNPRTAQPELLRPHLFPQIRLALGSWLARNRVASAMMDLSDGLSTDLARLCESSRVGARVFAERIPRVQIPANRIGKLSLSGLDPLQMALNGGEDYELLFVAPKRKQPLLQRAPGFKELTVIGEITSEKKIVLLDAAGRAHPLRRGGWDPFRKTRSRPTPKIRTKPSR
jgi:thiamine-monophosphate kinase